MLNKLHYLEIETKKTKMQITNNDEYNKLQQLLVGLEYPTDFIKDVLDENYNDIAEFMNKKKCVHAKMKWTQKSISEYCFYSWNHKLCSDCLFVIDLIKRIKNLENSFKFNQIFENHN